MILQNIVQLGEVLNSLSNQKMPINIGYKIMKLEKEIENDIAFYKQKLEEIISMYGQKDEEGKFVTLDNGNIKISEGMEEECINAFTVLDNTETDLPKTKLPIEALSSIELTPRELKILSDIIEE